MILSAKQEQAIKLMNYNFKHDIKMTVISGFAGT